MPLQGSLKDFSLADIFQLIGLQKKTGILVLRSDLDEIKILFDRGMIVHADSRLKKIEDRIGQLLVRSGKISQELLKRALEIQKETLQQLGYVLIENDMITLPELKDALQKQILQIIYRLFRWKTGEYEFHTKNAVDYNKDFIEPTPAEKILMEGIRMVDEWPLIEQVIPSYDIIFKKTPTEKDKPELSADHYLEEDGDILEGLESPHMDSRLANLDPRQTKIFDLIDGTKDINSIIEISPFNEFETCKTIVELEKLYLIEKTELIYTDDLDESPKIREKSRKIEISFQSLIPTVVYMIITVIISIIFIFYGINGFRISSGYIYQDLYDTDMQIRHNHIRDALRIYFLINNSYPDLLEELVSMDYIDRNIIYDKNNNLLFNYTREGSIYNLTVSDKDR